MLSRFNIRFLYNSIFVFFIFGCIFPTIRVLLIGNETSKTILEYFVSSLLDIYILFLAIYSFYPILKRGKLPVLNFFDWIVQLK